MAFEILPSTRFLKAFKGLDNQNKKRLRDALGRLTSDPFPDARRIKLIQGCADDYLEYKIGDYRVLYDIQGKQVHLLDLVHRSELDRAIRNL